MLSGDIDLAVVIFGGADITRVIYLYHICPYIYGRRKIKKLSV